MSDETEPPTYPAVHRTRLWPLYAFCIVVLIAVTLDYIGRLDAHNSTQNQIRTFVCGVVAAEPPHKGTDPITAYLVKTYDCTNFKLPTQTTAPNG